MAGSSKSAVLSAVVGNSVVMTAKFIAWGFTGSGSMLSEGIHSAADVLNQILLLVGIVRSERDADPRFPVGYGRERYIWALISAVGIFFLGCGVTLYHGVHGLMQPAKPLGDLTWAIAVLVLSLAVEGWVFTVALRGILKEAAGRPMWKFLTTEADPSATAILLEDAAACLGILFALGGIGMAKLTGETYWDSIGSILIALLLGFVAIALIWRNHTLLIGQSIPEDRRHAIRQLLIKQDAVEDVVRFKARMIDLKTYDIMADIEFDGAVIAKRLTPKLREEYEAIDTYEDFEDFAMRYADDVLQALGDEVDAIEAKIKEAVPEAKYVDLEMN